MFPFVPSNSLLHVVEPRPAAIRPGDIVCYPGPHQVTAHRVVRMDVGPGGRIFVTRGDAQWAEERIEERAIAFVVQRVEHGRFGYDVDGVFGRVAAHTALRGGLALRVATALGLGAVKLRRRFLQTWSSANTTRATDARLASVAPPAALVARQAERTGPQPIASETPDGLLRLLNHELRTPLNGILGFLEVLLGELDGPLIGDERENLGVVRDAGKQLLSLVSEVLDLVAAVASDCEELPELLDMVEVLEAEQAVLEDRRGVRPVYVRVDVPPDAATLTVDRAALVRVLRVLGEMAIDATVSGQVSLQASATANELHVHVLCDGLVLQPTAEANTRWSPPDSARPSSPSSGDRRSSPGERDDRVRRLRLDMVARLVERSLGRLEVSLGPAGSELVLVLPRDGRGLARAPATRADIPLAVRYLAATGHDLRTPLNAILGFSDLVAMQQPARWSESQHKSLAIVRERARDLAFLVDDMIDWAKLELGDLRLVTRPHDAAALIERAVAHAIEHSGLRGLQVELELSPGLGELLVDGDRFVQALVGLMDHAARAMPAPTVTLRAERVAAAAGAPACLRLEVNDPGLEIRIEDRAHIFAAFRPSFAPTGQRVAGLHLGTSVARALVRAHGGDVWFESRPGQGTTFVASLPEPCLA